MSSFSFSNQMDDLSRTLDSAWRARRLDIRAKTLQWANDYLYEHLRIDKLLQIRDEFLNRVKTANHPMDLYVPIFTYSRIFNHDQIPTWGVVHDAIHQGVHTMICGEDTRCTLTTIHEVISHTDLLLRLNHQLGPKFVVRCANTRVVESIPHPGHWVYEYEIRVEFWPTGHAPEYAARIREVGEKYRDYVPEVEYYYNGGCAIVKDADTCPHCSQEDHADTGTVAAQEPDDEEHNEVRAERRTMFCASCGMWVDSVCFGPDDICNHCELDRVDPAPMCASI